jgi:hypothetical protein
LIGVKGVREIVGGEDEDFREGSSFARRKDFGPCAEWWRHTRTRGAVRYSFRQHFGAERIFVADELFLRFAMRKGRGISWRTAGTPFRTGPRPARIELSKEASVACSFVPRSAAGLSLCMHHFPKTISDSGEDAMRRFAEFFTANMHPWKRTLSIPRSSR